MTHRLCQGLLAVTGTVGAFDGPLAHLHRAAAIKGVLRTDRPRLQGGGQHNRFEGGTRFVGVVEGFVPPHLVEGFALLHLAALDLIQEGLVNDGAVIVQVIVGRAGHTQDAAGLAVHDDDEPALPDVVGLDALL